MRVFALLLVLGAVAAFASGGASGTTSAVTCPAGPSSTISSAFNKTQIGAGRTIWFSSVMVASGVGPGPTSVRLRDARAVFSANGTTFTIPLPDAAITFSPTATSATTGYAATGGWTTIVPAKVGGNVFLSGAGFSAPSSLPGSIKPVKMTGTFLSDKAGLKVSWKWAAAVYTSFAVDPGQLGIKPVDNRTSSAYQNSDHAGTPEAYKSFLVAGATGSGGSNYTGGYTGTAAVIPLTPPGIAFETPIAFQSDRDGNDEIYTMAADGTGPTNVTNHLGADLAPQWSPDGSKILFGSNRTGSFNLYTMNPDGSGVTNLNNDSFNDLSCVQCMRWSPSGGKIAFVSTRGSAFGALFTMNADGTGRAQLNSFAAVRPSWSPDSARVVFEGNPGAAQNIWIANADGSGLTQLTTGPDNDAAPVFSPDGTKIAYISQQDTAENNVWLMNADGSGQTRITNYTCCSPTAASSASLAWSSDGTALYYARQNGNDGFGNQFWDVYRVNADGSGETKLIDGPTYRILASEYIRVRDSGILFQGNNGCNYEIYGARADGSGVTDLTNSPGADGAPDAR